MDIAISTIIGGIAFVIIFNQKWSFLVKMLVFAPVAFIAVAIDDMIQTRSHQQYMQIPLSGYEGQSSLERELEKLRSPTIRIPDTDVRLTPSLENPSFDTTDLMGLQTLLLEDWKKEIDIAGKRISYWDYYGCVSKNFPHLEDPSYVSKAADATIALVQEWGMDASEVDPKRMFGGFSLAAYLQKMICKYQWDWDIIDRIESSLKSNDIEVLGKSSLTKQVQNEVFEMFDAAGMSQFSSLVKIFEGVAALHHFKICESDFKQDGCENLYQNLKSKNLIENFSTFSKEFDINQSIIKSDSLPRLLLSRDPNVYMYSDYTADMRLIDFAIGAMNTIGSKSGLKENDNINWDALPSFLASIDNHWPPGTTNIREDAFRFFLAFNILFFDSQRHVQAKLSPDQFQPLSELHFIFSTKAQRPNCKSSDVFAAGTLPNHSAFYCPQENVMFVEVTEETEHLSDKEISFFSDDLANINHELAHYFFSRFGLHDVAFLNEGLATALGEASLRTVHAAIRSSNDTKIVAESHDFLSELFFEDEAPTISAEKVLEVHKIVSETSLTDTQARLLCIVERVGISGEDIELHLKQSQSEFYGAGEVGYARAWILFELIRSQSIQNDQMLHDKLAEFYRTASNFNTEISSSELSRARNTFKEFASSATAHAHLLLQNTPISCDA